MIEAVTRVSPLVWIGALLAVLALGFVVLLRRRRDGIEEAEFANTYRNRLIAYVNGGGEDDEAYTWLTLRAPRMQEMMGAYGIMTRFRPPFANYMYSNWPIVLNALPEVQRHISEDRAWGGRMNTGMQYARLLDEALLRYAGTMEDADRLRMSELRNPIAWLRAGMETVLAAPFGLVAAFGLLPRGALGAVRAAASFKLVASAVALLGVVGSVIAVVVDGAEAWGKVSALFGR